MSYSVIIARSAAREYERLPKSLVRRIAAKLEALADDPRPPGCVKLADTADLWRIRVGDYRVDDDERVVDVNRIRHRRDAYE